MFKNSEDKIPIKRALGYVLLSVLVIWGSLSVGWIVHRTLLQKRQRDPHFSIVALLQSCPQKEQLATWQLAELLELSRDKPQNLYSFNTDEAAQKLLRCPAIKRAKCVRLYPGVVHVDYSLREPRALLLDFENVAVDREGYSFLLMPFFTPKRLPEIYTGNTQLSYSQPLNSAEGTLAFAILDDWEEKMNDNFRLVRVDTHRAYAPSAGQREVVLVIEKLATKQQKIVRLSTKEHQKSLAHYLALQETFDKLQKQAPSQVIDLRAANIAIVK